jgi:sugar lactone lactonase YvrE
MPYGDAAGRGALYRLQDGEAAVAVSGVGLSNGLGWSPDARVMYLVDTRASHLDAFDFDAATGSLGTRRAVLDLAGDAGVPDGMCVDAEGCLWVAIWDGAQVRRYADDGRLLAAIPMPVSRPTSCCFIDDALVITSAAHGLSTDALARQPHAGAVFAIRPGVSGPGATPWVRT